MMATKSPAVGEVDVRGSFDGSLARRRGAQAGRAEERWRPGQDQQFDPGIAGSRCRVFRRQIEEWGRRRPQITIFASQNDRALHSRSSLARGATRLERSISHREDYQSQLGDLKGITVVDISAIKAGDRVNHDTYASSPEIVRLIGNRLIEGQVITDSDVTAPERPGDGGSAACLLITAPIVF